MVSEGSRESCSLQIGGFGSERLQAVQVAAIDCRWVAGRPARGRSIARRPILRRAVSTKRCRGEGGVRGVAAVNRSGALRTARVEKGWIDGELEQACRGNATR